MLSNYIPQPSMTHGQPAGGRSVAPSQVISLGPSSCGLGLLATRPVSAVPLPADALGGVGEFISTEFNLQTVLLLGAGAYIIYKTFFSNRAKEKRAELRKARQRHVAELAKIKATYA